MKLQQDITELYTRFESKDQVKKSVLIHITVLFIVTITILIFSNVTSKPNHQLPTSLSSIGKINNHSHQTLAQSAHQNPEKNNQYKSSIFSQKEQRRKSHRKAQKQRNKQLLKHR